MTQDCITLFLQFNLQGFIMETSKLNSWTSSHVLFVTYIHTSFSLLSNALRVISATHAAVSFSQASPCLEPTSTLYIIVFNSVEISFDSQSWRRLLQVEGSDSWRKKIWPKWSLRQVKRSMLPRLLILWACGRTCSAGYTLTVQSEDWGLLQR